STQIHTDVATKEQMIKIHSAVKYQIQDDTVASLSICMAYRVSPFDEIIRIDKDKKQINFSADFISPLLCSTYDTMRGIFHEKTKDTFLSKYSVPLSSPAMLASFNKFKVVDD
ncbi:MAG: hypothetical protein K6F21_03220, partial [Bacteroidales bacterium]|nr:hypothetical protein [Bacteroidales bacterium]